MKKILSIFGIFVVCLFLFSINTYAVSISIDSFSSTVVSGDEFVVTFSSVDLSQSSMYYVKGLGGPSFINVDTWNNSWLQQNSAWSNMPSFNTASESSYSGSIKTRFDTSVSAGIQQFKLRIKDSSSDPTFDSGVVNISVATPQPTPTPTPTPTQNPTIVPTSTPTKSTTPTTTKSPTPRPILTIKPTSTPEVLGDSTQEASPDSVLGETSSPEPSQVKTGSKKSAVILGAIFTGLGVFAMGIAGYAAYAKSKSSDS